MGGFLVRALRWYREQGVTVERVMSGISSCYRSKLFARTVRRLGLRHIRTRPYAPKTNGKAERFIQSMLREWAYAATFPPSDERNRSAIAWTDPYNTTRPHAGIGGLTPWRRVTNLLGHDS